MATEGQQQESVLRELRASLDRCVEDVSVLCQNSTEYQMDIQARDSELFEMKELIFKLSVGLDECRDGIQKVQSLPESGSDSLSDQREQMKILQHDLGEALKQLEIQEKTLQDGERQMRRLQDEVAAARVRPKPEVQEGLPIDVQAALETRFAQIEETLRKNQQQYSQWQGDSVEDFQSVEAYLTQVHTMVTEMHHRTEAASSSTPDRPRVTKLSVAARKGDTRVEVDSPEACRVGEVVLLGEREAKMVIDEGSLVFRFPLERDYPEGTIARPLAENEFLQAEGDRLCVYRRGQEDDIHFVCYVDLLERSTPKGVILKMLRRTVRMLRTWKRVSSGLWMPERPQGRPVLVAVVSWFLPCHQCMNGVTC